VRRVCAWCEKELGWSESPPGFQNAVTHGMCEECAYHLFAQIGMPLRKYLDGLGAPVLVMNPDGSVKTVNSQATELVQKELSEIEGNLGGDVFECAYASLPGGCGQTVHCSGCTIRKTVMETFETGQSRLRVPAYLNRESSGEAEQIRFLISTEKVADIVLLRVDEVGGA